MSENASERFVQFTRDLALFQGATAAQRAARNTQKLVASNRQIAANTQALANGQAVTNATLASMDGQMREHGRSLGLIEAQIREQGEQQRQQLARAELESRRRSVIFEMEDRVERIRSHVERAPAAALFSIRVIADRIANFEITPEQFDQYADKDRVRAFHRLLKQTESEAITGCIRAEQARVQNGLDRLTLISAIDEVNEVRRLVAERDAIEAQITRTSSQQSVKTLAMVAVSLVLIGTCVGAVAGIPLLIQTLRSGGASPTPAASQLQQRLAYLRSLALETRLSAPPLATYASTPPAELARLKAEYEDEIRSILIIDKHGEPIIPSLLD